jgi:hypothetical protein
LWNAAGASVLAHRFAHPCDDLIAYAKNEKENLTKAERNELAKMADAIFNKYGR